MPFGAITSREQKLVFVKPAPSQADYVDTGAKISRVLERFAGFLVKNRYPKKEIGPVCLAVEEALLHVVERSQWGDLAAPVQLHYLYLPQSRCLLITVQAEEAEFGLRCVPDRWNPDMGAAPGVRSLVMRKEAMTWVRFNDRGTYFAMCKRL